MRQLVRRLRRVLGRDGPSVEPALIPYADLPVRPTVPQRAVVLWFRDGTAATLDPRDPRATALQTLAVRLREPHT